MKKKNCQKIRKKKKKKKKKKKEEKKKKKKNEKKRTCQTRVPPNPFFGLQTCWTRVRPIPFSELQTCWTRVGPVPFSELGTCQTRVRPDPFSELRTWTPNQGSAWSFLQTPNWNSELQVKTQSWTKLYIQWTVMSYDVLCVCLHRLAQFSINHRKKPFLLLLHG